VKQLMNDPRPLSAQELSEWTIKLKNQINKFVLAMLRDNDAKRKESNEEEEQLDD
jgi:hypothetical protein